MGGKPSGFGSPDGSTASTTTEDNRDRSARRFADYPWRATCLSRRCINCGCGFSSELEEVHNALGLSA